MLNARPTLLQAGRSGPGRLLGDPLTARSPAG